MRTAFITLAVAALAGCTAPPPVAEQRADRGNRRTSGRTGSTVRHDDPERRVFRPPTATLCSTATGRSIWVNQLQDGCGGFGRWDVLVTEPIGTQYCRGDLDPFVRSGQQDPGAELPPGGLRPLHARLIAAERTRPLGSPRETRPSGSAAAARVLQQARFARHPGLRCLGARDGRGADRDRGLHDARKPWRG